MKRDGLWYVQLFCLVHNIRKVIFYLLKGDYTFGLKFLSYSVLYIEGWIISH